MKARWQTWVLALLPIGAACSQSESHAGEQGPAARSGEQATELERKLQEALRHLDAELAALRQRADQAHGDAKTQLEQVARTLEQKRAFALAKLEELRTQGVQAWRELEAGLRSSADELKQAAEEARSKWVEADENRSGR